MQGPRYLVLVTGVLVMGMNCLRLFDYHARDNSLDIFIHGGRNYPEETLDEVFSEVGTFID